MAVVSLKNKVYSRSLNAGNTSFFNPISISGLKLWLDASDTSTISLSSTKVTQWTDKSINAYAFTQGTDANRPVSGTRTINSKNVIDFSTATRLTNTASNSTWKFMHDGQHTFFIVAFADTSSAFRIIVDNIDAAGGANPGIAYFLNTTDTLQYFVARAVNNSQTISSIPGSVTDNSQFYSSANMNTSAALADRSEVQLNNDSFVKNNTGTGDVNTSNPNHPLSIGNRTANDFGFDGTIAEIIIYDTNLSSGDVIKVRNYLSAKWGF
jgi:hypothetical protein